MVEKEILENANSFFYAAKRCEVDIKNKISGLFVPEFVNLAFACELYIKAISQSTQKTFDYGHNLKALYNKLNDAEKTFIISRYYINHVNVKVDSVAAQKEIEFYLEEVKDTFEDWRYIFDWCGSSYGIACDFFWRFANSLRFCAEKLINNKMLKKEILPQYLIMANKRMKKNLDK